MSSPGRELAATDERTTLEQTDAMLAELQQMPRVQLVRGLMDLLLDCRAIYAAKPQIISDQASRS